MSDFSASRVGRRIKAARRAKGLTQYDLSQMLGIRSMSVSCWERGVYLPQTERLAELSGLLSVSVDWILGIEAATVDACEAS